MTEYDEVKAILNRNGFWALNENIFEWICSNMDSESYQQLYDYYTSIGPDGMPYGTAKARTGDPDQWIYHRLESLFVNQAKTHAVPDQTFTGFVTHAVPDQTFIGFSSHDVPM